MDNRAFKHGSIASEAGFSYGPMQVVIKYLHNQRWIKLKKGKRYKDQPTRTRIFPEKSLSLYLTPLFLDSAEPFEAPYLKVGEPSDRWRRVVGDLPQDHPEILEMNRLNEYLEQHRWACKHRCIYDLKDFCMEEDSTHLFKTSQIKSKTSNKYPD